MKGKVIDSDGRNIILKVLKYFEEEKANNQLTFNLDQVIRRTCAATGISKSTLLNIKKEAKLLSQQASGNAKDGIKLTAPGKKRKPSSKRIVLSTNELNAVRNIVHSFNTDKNEIPTLNKILAIAQRDLNFKGQKSTLRKILLDELGYKFKKNSNSRPVLIQKSKKSTERIDMGKSDLHEHASNERETMEDRDKWRELVSEAQIHFGSGPLNSGISSKGSN